MERFLGQSVAEYGELFEPDRYPTSADDLVAEFGGLVVEHPDGSTETLGEVVGRVSPAVFETRKDAMEAIASAVSAGAVGRLNYTDRDPPVPGTHEFAVTQVSF